MQNKIVVGAIVILVVLGGVWYIGNKTSHKRITLAPINKAMEAKAAVSSINLGTVLTPVGTIDKPQSTFSPTTKDIYAVLNLNNTSSRTQISYIRYYEGGYVDSRVSHPSTDSSKYFHFQWTLKPGKVHKAGKYTLVFYVNGKKAQTINYMIK